MNLSSESYKLKELREVFDIFDLDKSGCISAKEMELVFKSLNIDATKEEIKSVINEMDTDGDGEISFEEFARVMGVNIMGNLTQAELIAAFQHFDQDGDGFITWTELKECMEKMGKNYTKREIIRMIKSVDIDGNGMISIDEFAKLFE